MPGDRPRIRALTDGDLPAVGDLFRAHTGRPADVEVLRGWIDGWPSAALVLDGTLRGFAVCCSFAPDIAEIANVLVAPGARGAGAGTALVGHVVDEARRRGLRSLVTVSSSGYQVLESSGSARAFYEAQRFETVWSTGTTDVLFLRLDEVPA